MACHKVSMSVPRSRVSVPEFAERWIQGKAWFPLHRLCQTLHQGGYFLWAVAPSGQVDGGGAAYRVGTDSSHIPHTSWSIGAGWVGAEQSKGNVTDFFLIILNQEGGRLKRNVSFKFTQSSLLPKYPILFISRMSYNITNNLSSISIGIMYLRIKSRWNWV